MSTVPCPSWCHRESGHPFDSLTHDGHPVRVHARRVAQFADDTFIQIVADEVRHDGETMLGAPFIVVAGEVELVASQARQSAAALLNAADALDEITRS